MNHVVWEDYSCEETHRWLRKLLEIDSLPRIKNTSLVANITQQFLASAQARKQSAPQLIGFGGGPGSGKTFLYERMKDQLPENAVIHDPDLVMQSIPQYMEDAKNNPADAFKKWELPARQLANEILLKALIARYHIIYMRTFTQPESLNFSYAAKTLGYTFDIHLLTCNLEVAISRIKKRERQTKRHIPPEIVAQRHQAFLTSIPEIIRVADNYSIFENSKDTV